MTTANIPQPPGVPSLLDAMKDGQEYGSIVALRPQDDASLTADFDRAIAELERVRERPCVCYVGNLVKSLPNGHLTAITPVDHLPFTEMIDSLTPGPAVDVFLTTPGGSAEQVAIFVDALRRRFGRVEFLVPYMAMSAGTLWALSGDRIWMDERAYLGPIDPQVPSRDGRFVPLQSLIALLGAIGQDGNEALARGEDVPWHLVAALQQIDSKELGSAITATEYVKNIAAGFLERFKFNGWTTHAPGGAAVTAAERTERALKVAGSLADHGRWKAHGHAINRIVSGTICASRLTTRRRRSQARRSSESRRLWALFFYVFEKSAVAKIITSRSYRFVLSDPSASV